MADAWGGSWGPYWGASWGAAVTPAEDTQTGGGWVDLDEVERRPKRQKKEDAREAARLAELRRAYNAAMGIVEEAPAEATEAVRKAVEGYSRPSEAQALPVVDWQALARDVAALEALSAALDAFMQERALDEEAVEMLLLSL